MKLRRSAAMVLLAAAFTTATAGRAGAQSAPARPAENASQEVAVETPDAGPDQPGVVVTLALPTTIRPHAPDAGDIVVPLTPLHRPTAASHGSSALYGFLIGVAGGLALGLQAGSDRGGEGDAGAGLAIIFAPVIFGLLGLGVGALVGALSGPSDSP